MHVLVPSFYIQQNDMFLRIFSAVRVIHVDEEEELVGLR